ncbi:MAG: Ig-like domain repeat protein [Candidatus Woesearchaeota archaeon]
MRSVQKMILPLIFLLVLVLVSASDYENASFSNITMLNCTDSSEMQVNQTINISISAQANLSSLANVSLFGNLSLPGNLSDAGNWSNASSFTANETQPINWTNANVINSTNLSANITLNQSMNGLNSPNSSSVQAASSLCDRISVFREQASIAGPKKTIAVHLVLLSQEFVPQFVFDESVPANWQVLDYSGSLPYSIVNSSHLLYRLSNLTGLQIFGYRILAPEAQGNYTFAASLNFVNQSCPLPLHKVEVVRSRASFEVGISSNRSLPLLDFSLLNFSVRNIGDKSVEDYHTFFYWYYNKTVFDILWVEKNCRLAHGLLSCEWNTFLENETKFFSIAILPKLASPQFVKSNITYDPPEQPAKVSVLKRITGLFSSVFSLLKEFFVRLFSGGITGEVVKEVGPDKENKNETRPAPNVSLPETVPTIEPPAAPNRTELPASVPEPAQPVKKVTQISGSGSSSSSSSGSNHHPEEPKAPPEAPKKIWYTSVAYNFLRASNVSTNQSRLPAVEIFDSNHHRVEATELIEQNSYGSYDISFSFSSGATLEILNLSAGFDHSKAIGFEEFVPAQHSNLESFSRVISIDPSSFNFTHAVLRYTALGTKLFKCADWNFTLQKCLGSWENVMNLTPGQEYSVLFNNLDPAFAEASVSGPKKLRRHDFKSFENPIFEINMTSNITSYLLNPDGDMQRLPDSNVLRKGFSSFEITVDSRRYFRPGLYKLLVYSGNASYEQNFTWGVLAVNTQKSIYNQNELAKIGMAVLDDLGKMVCNANVTLLITSPDNLTTVLSTDNALIKVSPECAVYGITELPDYYANYTTTIPGTYSLNLTAVTFNGVRSVSDSFIVGKSDFDVSRKTATRIFPFVPYIVNISITANHNYKGTISDFVPSVFAINPQSGLTISELGDTKSLSWDVDLKKGDTLSLAYEYDAPDTSPMFYLLGKLQIGSWQEYRYWQIASDAGCSANNINAPVSPLKCAVDSSFSMNCTVVVNGKDTFTQHAQYSLGSSYPVITGTSVHMDTFSSNPVSHSSSGTVTDVWTVNCRFPGVYAVRCNVVCGTNTTSSTRQVNITDAYPHWSANKTDYPSTYSKTTQTKFNVTWADNKGISLARIELNFSGSKVNYTMNRITGSVTEGVYNFSRVFKVGSYQWKGFANDTFNQKNSTPVWRFNIVRATPVLNITINRTRRNWTVQERSSLWLNGSIVVGESPYIELYLNSTKINNRSSPAANYTYFRKPGRYNVTAKVPQTQNYTAAQTIILFINVTDASPPNITLLLPLNKSFSNNGNVNFTFNVADYSNIANCSLYYGTSLITVNKTVNKAITQRFVKTGLAVDVYDWKIRCFDVLGYSSNSTVWRVIVDKTAPAVVLSSPVNRSFSSTGTVQQSYTLTETNKDRCILYTNYSSVWKVNQSQVPVSGSNSFVAKTVPEGTYIWNVWCNDSAKFSSWHYINWTIFVDMYKPKINFTGPTPANRTNLSTRNVVINVTLFDKNPNTFILNWNGTNQSIKPYGTYVNISKTLNDGVYSYYAVANDSFGQTNNTGKRILIIDATAPRLYLRQPSNRTWINNNSVKFEYNITENLAGLKNCSLIINNKLNRTNTTVQLGITQYFRVNLSNSLGYNWMINCSDKFRNRNSSPLRLIKVDSAFPTVKDEKSNTSGTVGIGSTVCLNLTTSDAFSGVRNVTVELDLPATGKKNYSFSNATGGCGGAGASVWSQKIACTETGSYAWVRTFVYDNAVNKNTTVPSIAVAWSAVTQIFLNINMSKPKVNFELNESKTSRNSSFLQNCNVTCNQSSTGSCEGVLIYAQYKYGTWIELNKTTTLLTNSLNFKNCSTLAKGQNCSQSFNITVGKNSGANTFGLRCMVYSANGGTIFSKTQINLTIDDFPVARFTSPLNRSYLRSKVRLNASSSSDDKSIVSYSFEIDNNAAFSHPSTLCVTTNKNCTLNTTSQTQCSENSWACFLRLNVTDISSLKNSTIINVQIDNAKPTVRLNLPSTSSWSASPSVSLKYTPTDQNLAYCVLYDNSSGFAAVQTHGSITSGSEDTFTDSLADGSYKWNVRCNDSAGNFAFNNTNRTFSVDTTYPKLVYAGGTLANNSFAGQDYVYVNVSVNEKNTANLTFYLYNVSRKLVNSTFRSAGSRSVNFTKLNPNSVYYFNVSVLDKAGNRNRTILRKITLDNTRPKIVYGLGTSQNGVFVNRNWIYVNVSVTETNFNNITFYLYNISGLVNRTNYTSSSFFINFTNLKNTNMVYFYNVTVRDKSGFSNSTVKRNITLDTTLPSVKLLQPSNANITRGNTNLRFNFSVIDTNIKNCSLYSNFSGAYKLNQTNTTVRNGTKTVFKPLTLQSGTYLWNVRCYDMAGNNAFNKTNWTLQVDISAPSAFILRYPVNGKVSKVLTPLLNWSPTVEAHFKNYTVRVSENKNFASINYIYSNRRNISNTSYQVSSAWTANRVFFWRVTAYDTLGFYTNATQDFNYTTDTISPRTRLQRPLNNSVWTSSNLVQFIFNATDSNPIANCTLLVNGVTSSVSPVSNNTATVIQRSLANGNYKWYVNCTDIGGNVNKSLTRNVSVKVQIPIITFFESYGSSGAPTIDLNYTQDQTPNSYAKVCVKNSENTLVTATTVQGVKVNGFLIKASQPINFSGSFSGAQNAYISWRLYYNNGTQEPLIAQDGDRQLGGTLYTATAQSTVSSKRNSTPSQDIHLGPNDKVKIINYLYYSTGANVEYTHYWDNSQSFVKLYGYILGWLKTNLSAPLTDPAPAESAQFNATCNISCSSGYCMGTEVTIQTRPNPSSPWSTISYSSGNIRLYSIAASNPQSAGNFNGSAKRNFTLVAYAISRNNQLRCLANSTYSSVAGSLLTTVTVRDITKPSASLVSPANASFSSSGNLTLGYIPKDNYNVSNCSLVINRKLNQTNKTITEDLTNYFRVKNLGSGRYNWSVNCTDSFANKNNSISWLVIVDRTRPLIRFNNGTAKNNTFASRNYIFVNVSAFDANEANITFYLYNSSKNLVNLTTKQAGSRSINFTKLNSNMVYYYNVSIRDKANNYNNTRTRKITLDTTPPTSRLDAPSTGSWTRTNPQFTYTPYDANLDACKVYHNASGIFKANASNTNVVSTQQSSFTVALSDGSHKWTIWCNDTAGNYAFNSTNRTILVDKTVPKIFFGSNTEPADTYFNRDWIYVNTTVLELHESNITFKLFNETKLLNLTTLAAGTRSINFTKLASNKDYYYNVTAVDLAGNSNSTLTRKLTLDSTFPTIQLASPGDREADPDGLLTMSYIPDDPLSPHLDNCELFGNFSGSWKLNQTDISPREQVTNSFLEMSLPYGTYIWNVRCNDSAGNSNWSASNFTVFVDNIAPVVLLLSPKNASYTSNSVLTFEYSFSEAHEEVCILWSNFSGTWKKNETDPTPRPDSVNSIEAHAPDGSYKWNIWCNDSAGNHAFNNTNRTLFVDRVPPKIFYAGGTESNNSFMSRNWLFVNVSIIDPNKANVTFYLYNSTKKLVNLTVLTGSSHSINFTKLNGNMVYFYNVTAADRANNKNSTVLRKLTLDSTKPRSSYLYPTPPENWNQSSTTVVINVSHIDVNPNTFIFTWNTSVEASKPYIGNYTNITKQNLVDGVYTYYMWSDDKAGNVNQTRTRTLRVDTKPPLVQLRLPLNNKWINTENLTFWFNVSDQLLSVANCTLLINGSVNQTNRTIRKDILQSFKVKGLRDSGYSWQVNCSDSINNRNGSPVRITKIDLTYPTIELMSANVTKINITQTLCLNATVFDALSGVNQTWAIVRAPNSIQFKVPLTHGATSCNKVNNPDVYSSTYKVTNVGIYNWTFTWANDTASNKNSTYTGIIWNSTSIGTITVNATKPSINLRLNESEPGRNYTFELNCKAYCDDKPQNCTNVTLYPMYNYSDISDINSTSPFLRSHNNSYNLGNLTAGGSPKNYTFVIRTTTDSGHTSWSVFCRATSNIVGTYYSKRQMNISVNDHPHAFFTYPSNASWLARTERLNASASIDEGSIISYSFELDNNVAFSSPTTLCASQSKNCSFNTITQGQCAEQSTACFLRLNVTDNEGLRNDYRLSIGIDNIGPTSVLDILRNFTNISQSSVNVNASVTDLGSGVDTVVFKYRQNTTSAWNTACVKRGLPYQCAWNLAGLADSKAYQLRVFSNDSKSNLGLNSTHSNITIDKTPPKIMIQSPVNNSWNNTVIVFFFNATDRTSRMKNCSLVINNKVNLTQNATAVRMNFSQQFAEGAYNWRINCTDYSGNTNTTKARIFHVDTTGPVLVLDRPRSFYNTSRALIPLNASVSDSGIGVKVAVYEYRQNSSSSWIPACNSSVAPFNCTWNSASLPDSNQYAIRAKAFDLLDNNGSLSIHYNITIDRTNPIIRLIGPLNNSRDIDGKVIFLYNVTDALSKISNCSLIIDQKLNRTNKTVTKGVQQYFRVTGIVDGFHKWSINCTDKVGNKAYSLTYNLSVFPDTEAPVVRLVSPSNRSIYTRNTVLFVYNVTDMWSGIKNCSLYIGSRLNKSSNNVPRGLLQTFTTNLGDGNYSWSVKCFDNSTGYFNMGSSLKYNLSVIKATSIIVSVVPEHTLFEKGEIARFNISTHDRFNNLLETNITTDIVTSNTSLPWWNTSFKYRSQINITPRQLLEANYTMNHTLNTMALINASKMRQDALDLRVVWWDNETNSWKHLARILRNINKTTTEVMFRIQRNITSKNYFYYVYYGNSTVSSAPSSRSEIFFFYDSFTANTLGNYSLASSFDDSNEDQNSTLRYDSSKRHLNYTSSAGNGKSIRMMSKPIKDAIIEVRQNYQQKNGLYAKLELGTLVSGSSYYYFWASTNNYPSELGRYNDGSKTFSTTSDTQYTDFNVNHLLTFIVYSNDTTVFLKSFVDGSALISYNDSSAQRLLGPGGFGPGAFQFNGSWDNISVRRFVKNLPLTGNLKEERFVFRSSNSSGKDALWTMSWNTASASLGNYSAVSLAANSNYLNGVGYASFRLGPDLSPPVITPLLPVHGLNTTNTTIVFNWLATDRVDTNISCNFSLNGVFKSKVYSVNSKQSNYTLANPAAGFNYWNVTCIDDANNSNKSQTRFVVVVKAPQTFMVMLAPDNRSVSLNWSNASYSDYYAVYIGKNQTYFYSTPNITLSKVLNWTDQSSASSLIRFYRIAVVRGDARKFHNNTVGKHLVTLYPDWNMVSLPLILANSELKNQTNNGYDPLFKPSHCVKEIWRYNSTMSALWEETVYEGSYWLPGSGSTNFTSLDRVAGYWFYNNLTQNCNYTVVGSLPTSNTTVHLNSDYNLVGWNSEDSSLLPTNAQPDYPLQIAPVNSIKYAYYYDSVIDQFKGSIHYDNWGWWPSSAPRNLLGLEPGKSYYLKTLRKSNWTLRSIK